MTRERLEFLRKKYQYKSLKEELERIAYRSRCGYISQAEMEVISWAAYESLCLIKALRRQIATMHDANRKYI